MWSLRRRGELSAGEWLRSFRRPLRTHVFRADDPLPTLGHHAGVALQLGQALGARTHAGAPPKPAGASQDAPVEVAA